jgi:putative peptidoglycan lipid II flippase
VIRSSRFHSDHILILQGASWVIFFLLLGRIVIAAKEMAIASQFGVSGVVDAYQVAFSAVTWVPLTIVAALSVVLVPLFARVRIAAPQSEALFVREVQSVTLALGLLLILITVLAGSFYVKKIAGNLPAETQALSVRFILWLSPVAALTLVIGVLSARLQSQGRQLNTLFDSIPALVILLCILLPFFPVRSDALLWGTLIGTVLNTIFLSIAANTKNGIGWKVNLHTTSPYWSEIYKAVGVMAIGQFVMSFVLPLDQYMAAQLGGGAIATLGYANRLLSLGMSVGALAIMRGAMPVLANAVAEGKHEHGRTVAIKWSILVLMVGIVTIAASWCVAPFLVRLLFERGAFTATDTAVVTTCFRWGLIQVPFYLSGLVLVQLLATYGQYRVIALAAVGNFFIKVIMNVMLVPHFGLAGIMMATNVMYIFTFTFLWLYIIYIKK